MTTTAGEFYESSIALIAQRLTLVAALPPDVTYLNAEAHALHVRKTVEGLAFAALSAAEHGAGPMVGQRTKDPIPLLAFLESKRLLTLPKAQDVTQSDGREPRIVAAGAGSRDLHVPDLRRVWGSASEVLHERHPARLTDERLREMVANVRRDAAHLRAWLWNHITFLGGAGFLVQMGLRGTPSFMVQITKIAPLPGD